MGRFISFAAVIAVLSVLSFVIYVALRRISLRAEQHRCPVCLNGGDVRDYPTGWSVDGHSHDGHLWMCRKHLAERQHIDALERDLGSF